MHNTPCTGKPMCRPPPDCARRAAWGSRARRPNDRNGTIFEKSCLSASDPMADMGWLSQKRIRNYSCVFGIGEPALLSHTTIGVADIQSARSFYDPFFEKLGLVLKFSDEHWAGWKPPEAERPLFIITQPFDGQPASTGNGQMIALLASHRSLVDECHAFAIRHGCLDEGRPGLRPDYHAAYYGAYFRDPDGNKLCICCHSAE